MDRFEHILLLIASVGLLIFSSFSLGSSLSEGRSNIFNKFLNGLTDKKPKGVFAGIVGTLIFQSSSAFTLLTCGLVSAGTLTLYRCVPLIMGANIGSALSVLFLTLPFGEIFAALMPIFLLLSKFSKKHCLLFKITTYFSMLFYSFKVAEYMSFDISGLIVPFFTNVRCDILFFLLGALATALLQSSSIVTAMVLLIYQSAPEQISFITLCYLIIGVNVGTCSTAFLGSTGMNKSSLKCALIHLLFNLIGATLFLPILSIPYFAELFTNIFSNLSSPKLRVSMFHLFYNVATTAILLPFSDKLANLIINYKKVIAPITN